MMNLFRADLHMHSTFSDGSCTAEELMKAAKVVGLQALSITDHDSVAVYEEAFALAARYDLLLVTGVEFSAMHRGESVHILGYGFSWKSAALRTLCEFHKERRVKRNLKILSHLEKWGIVLSPSLFEGIEDKTWGRPHIAQALVQKGVVGSIQEAFDIYLGEGKKAYDPGESVGVNETIQVIHRAGGFAILAHPHLFKKKRFVKQLLEFDFDGLEGYYARLPPEQEKVWVDIAKKRGWLITGGSDYHGEVKPYSQIGSSWVNEATFQILYERSCASNQD